MTEEQRKNLQRLLMEDEEIMEQELEDKLMFPETKEPKEPYLDYAG